MSSEAINRSRTVDWSLRAYLLVAYAFVFAPIAASFVFSLNSDRFPSLPLKEFTLDWYALTFQDPLVIDAFKRSFLVAIPVGLVSTLLGFCAAYTDYRHSFRGKSIFNLLMLLPPTIPPVDRSIRFSTDRSVS